MSTEVFRVQRERFHLGDNKTYILQGTLPKETVLTARVGDENVAVQMEEWENKSALERFANLDATKGIKVTVRVDLSKKLEQGQSLCLEYLDRGKNKVWFSIKAEDLEKKRKKIQYFIEEETIDRNANTLRIRGWAASKEELSFSVLDKNKKDLSVSVQTNKRQDVVELFAETDIFAKCGFFVEVSPIPEKEAFLRMKSKVDLCEYKIETKRLAILQKKVIKYAIKANEYLRLYGGKELSRKVLSKLWLVRRPPIIYQQWIMKHLPGKEELAIQRKEKFSYQPKISVVVPLYKTPEKYLLELVKSLEEQTYTNWELCLSDGSGENSPIAGLLKNLQEKEKRIKVHYSEEALHISENTNKAIEIAGGDFIAFADHDDVLTPNALYECVKAFNKDREIDVLYSDEDKMSMDGHKFFQPHFKPDFNIDLLRTVNYICHLFVVSRKLVQKVGDLDHNFDGAQDYDFIFRCIEQAHSIYHVPKILYHWRSHENSTSENPESKIYAFDAGQRVIEAHYKRVNIHAKVEKGEYLGLYKTTYIIEKEPLVSIIIPNKDHIDDLDRCIRSIEEKSTYTNYEYIIVENNSTEDETFKYYKKLEKENEKVHVVYYDGDFNYSKINNFGAKYAKGEFFWLLNNDTAIINNDCIEQLVGFCMRQDVGIVGARLYYEDDTIQHAGVVIGFGGIAGHCFVQQPRGSSGYCHRIICAQDYSAVTAACMMVKRSVFDEVDGLSEELKVAFNDIDFCMKVRQIKKLVVYNPYAELYHFESKSRGLEDTPEKVERFQREIATFERKWPKILKEGDPYYNPNLTLESQDFSLKRI